jgi:hypothetical protein
MMTAYHLRYTKYQLKTNNHDRKATIQSSIGNDGLCDRFNLNLCSDMRTEEEIRFEITVLEATILKVLQNLEDGEIDAYAADYCISSYKADIKVLKWVLNEKP